MNYRRLGKSGLQVSELSFGAWVTFAQQITEKTAEELMSIAYDAGQVFSITHDGQMTAMDAGTGAVNWTTQLTGQSSFPSPLTAVDGTVYVANRDNKIVALQQ